MTKLLTLEEVLANIRRNSLSPNDHADFISRILARIESLNHKKEKQCQQKQPK